MKGLYKIVGRFFDLKKNYFQYGFETDYLSAGLEPVLSHTEKSFMASCYRKISRNNKIKS